MATLFYAQVSTLDYAGGTASICIPDRESQIIHRVPFLSAAYEMPKPGETVAVIFEEINGQLDKGVILGRIYNGSNRPAESGEGIFYKEFSDSASVKYSPGDREIKFNVDTVSIRRLNADSIVCRNITQE